jgi:hypothetical protein
MMTGTRLKIGAALAAGLAIGGTLALTSSGASGQTPPEATDPVYVPYGTLTIELGDRSGQLVFDPAAPGDDVTQPLLNQQPCNQVTLGDISAGTGDLLSLVPLIGGVDRTGFGDSVQQPGEFLGVQTAGENCGRQAEVIGLDELLEIGLGSYFGSDVFVRSFSAAVDKKFNNDGKLTVGFDGGGQVLEEPVQTGGSIVSIAGTDIPGGVFTSATFGSTSNRDNRGLSIGDATLELVKLSGDFDVAVDCGQQVAVTGSGLIAETATFVRAENNVNPSYLDNDCDEVGVRVQILSDKVFWDNGTTDVNDPTSPQDVVGEVTIDFTPIPVADAAELEREIDFDAGGGTFDFRPLLWCTKYSKSTTVETDGTFTIVIDVTQPEYPDGTVATWCKVQDLRNLNGENIGQRVVVAGGGDPWVR